MISQGHAKEEKLLAMTQAAVDAEGKTRQVQQAAGQLQPAVKSLLKALKAAGPAEAAAAPAPSVPGTLFFLDFSQI